VIDKTFFLAIDLSSGVYLILGCLWEPLTLISPVVANMHFASRYKMSCGLFPITSPRTDTGRQRVHGSLHYPMQTATQPSQTPRPHPAAFPHLDPHIRAAVREYDAVFPKPNWTAPYVRWLLRPPTSLRSPRAQDARLVSIRNFEGYEHSSTDFITQEPDRASENGFSSG
jgi:hypothetical protein